MKKLFTSIVLLFSLALFSLQAQTVIHVEQAGTFLQLLTDATGGNITEVTDLNVSGKINGDDFKILQMLAKENLASLDMKDASIVFGGGEYYTYDNRFPQGHLSKLKNYVLSYYPKTLFPLVKTLF